MVVELLPDPSGLLMLVVVVVPLELPPPPVVVEVLRLPLFSVVVVVGATSLLTCFC